MIFRNDILELSEMNLEISRRKIVKHLYKYNLLQILRRWDDLFWALIFPIIMATLFYATFGSSTIDNMKAIPVACVHGENIAF